TSGNLPTVPAPDQGVPVLAEVDVVVVGGGTSGACAAIAAARRHVDVLVVEFQEGLGGVGTVGLIGRPYHGRNLGFTREVPFCDKRHNTEHKMEWYRKEIRRNRGRIWLGALGCGAFVDGQRVRGAVVATPLARGVVLADVVIDATGNGDVAVAAGAESMFGQTQSDLALQGTGLPLRPLGGTYVNTDYLLVDESDALDTWRAFVGSRAAADDAYDSGTFIQTRERRRVVGDHVLGYLDQIAGRTYPDSIVISGSDYDSHGYPREPFFALIPHTEKTLKANHPAPGGTCYTPYRCLLPRGLEGMLVTGLAISMHRDASAMVRMQKDMHNQGYAAGVAAAMAVQSGSTPRQIDVKALQTHLVRMGNLPEDVLTDQDSFPMPQGHVDAAVAHVADPGHSRDDRCRALAIVLSHPERSRPALKQAFASAEGGARLAYAKILGFLGDRDVVPVLIEALGRVDAWDAKILQGSMAEYAHLPTPIDAVILALGHTRDRRATPHVLEKLEMLDAGVTLSHHRAVALALEQLGDPAAAEPLARLLRKPGMGRHAMTRLEPLYDRQRDKRRRTGPLREIVLARALYRCGDHEGLGQEILEQYRRDVRGLFARHAAAVLSGNGK
ncbi:MAG: FAD-dependent oxidoreductase, partial [Planctomycetota bacterium]